MSDPVNPLAQENTASLGFIEHLKRQWLAMIDAVADPLALITRDYRVLRLNKAYAATAQEKKNQIRDYKGTTCYEVFAGRTSPCPHCQLQKAWEQKAPQSWITDDLLLGRKVEIKIEPLPLGFSLDAHAQTRSQPEPTPAQEGGLAVVHYRDFTATWLLQEKLAQADKLSALGTLASGVAHEINSPLAGILAFTQMIMSETPESSPHLSDLKEIEDAARKCRSIVESLLALGRPARVTDEKSWVNPWQILASTLRLASPMLKKYHIELVEQGPVHTPSPALVWGHPVRLSQVFLNLVTNAVHAMKETGGRLSVTLNSSDTHIQIAIQDTGPGIDHEVLPRIFDPFFTTKPVGEGTGLGLSIAYQICADHGGQLSVTSQAGQGARFTVELPTTHPHTHVTQGTHT